MNRGTTDADQGLLVHTQHPARIAEQNLALAGQLHVPPGAFEKPGVEGRFQPLDLHAYGGLNAIQTLRRPREMTCLGDGNEGSEEVQIKCR